MKSGRDFFMPPLAVQVVASMISRDLPAKSVDEGLQWLKNKLNTIQVVVREDKIDPEYVSLTVANQSKSITTVLSLLPVYDVSKKVDTSRETLVVSIGARSIDWEFFSGRTKKNEQ